MKLIVAYIALLSLQVPFNITYFFMFLASDIEQTGEQFGIGYAIIAVLYFAAIGIIGIRLIFNFHMACDASRLVFRNAGSEDLHG